MPESQAKLRFNCYLLKEGLADPIDAFREAYRPGGRTPMRPLVAKAAAPPGVRAFFQVSAENQPKWAQRLDGLFDGLAAIKNRSSRMVIFLPVGSRHFALCFGYGSSTLEWSNVETNFGLRVAARVMSPKAMKELRSLRLDGTARTQQVQVARDSDLRDMDIELSGEFVSRLVGRMGPLPDSDEDPSESGIDYEGALIAGDSIAFQMTADLHTVSALLDRFLDAVDATAVREEFAFVDSLEPLKRSEPPVAQLETLLASRIFGGSFRIARGSDEETESGSFEVALGAFACPDALSAAEIFSVDLQRSGDTVTLTSIDIDGLRETLQGWRSRYSIADLRNVRVLARDGNENPIGDAQPLINWLVFEARSARESFILTLGRWFRLQQDFAEKLDRDLSRLADVSATLQLPDWRPTRKTAKGQDVYHETDYNLAVRGAQWQVFDHEGLRLKGIAPLKSDGDEVEACDLFHIDGYLVHVKKWTGSQTMSHLLSQGAVSAETMRGDSAYHAAFVEVAAGCCVDHETAAKSAPRKVVYAIGARESLTLPFGLPTFSKVNLRSYANRIRALTANDPQLARINMV